MLVFAGFTPNSPLLFPSINTTRMDEVEETVNGLKELSDELYATHPDTVVILSESVTMYEDAISINVADPYSADLSDVGDLGYHKKYHPDFSLIDALQRFTRRNNLPVSLSTDEKLTYASAVPLHYLTEHLSEVRIVPVAPSLGLDAKSHFAFGAALKHLIMDSDKRIAIIASSDTAQTLTEDAPGGFHKDGAIFEEKLQAILRERNAAGLLQLDPELIENAKDTSHKVLCMLFGALDGVDVTPHIMSYEKPFGVGYTVVNFSL